MAHIYVGTQGHLKGNTHTKSWILAMAGTVGVCVCVCSYPFVASSAHQFPVATEKLTQARSKTHCTVQTSGSLTEGKEILADIVNANSFTCSEINGNCI